MKKAPTLLLLAAVGAGALYLVFRDRPAAGDGGASSNAPVAPRDGDAENPDRTRYDWASRPFDPELVGGTLRVAQAPPRSLNAVCRESEEAAKYLKYSLGAPLLMEVPDRVDGAYLAVPYAAESFPEESEDGRVHVWTLRDDVSWEDGRPVVAEDYVFTLRMMRAEGVTAPQRESFADLERLEAVDARRLRAVWRRRFYRAALSFGLDFHVAPAHAVPHDAAGFSATTSHLACGPYRVASFRPERLELALRDEYRRRPFPPRPHYVERLVYAPAADAVARYARFVAGEVDLAQLDFERFARAGDDPAFRAAGWRAPLRVPSFSLVFWNARDPSDPTRARPHPLLGDVRVRRAFDHLFDREGLARHAFRGASDVVTGPFPPGSEDHDASVSARPFDPARARALLVEAGFAPGADGVLARDGVRAAFRLVYPASPAPLFAETPARLQEAARTAGVAVELAPLPMADFLAAGAARSADAVLSIWLTTALEPDLADTFRSDGALSGGNNWGATTDPSLDALFDRLASERGAARRSEIRRAIHRRLHADVPASFLFSGAAPLAVSRRFANVEAHDLGVRIWDFVERSRFEARGLGR